MCVLSLQKKNSHFDRQKCYLIALFIPGYLRLTEVARGDSAKIPRIPSASRQGNAKEKQPAEAGSDVTRASACACTDVRVRVRVRVRKRASSPKTVAV